MLRKERMLRISPWSGCLLAPSSVPRPFPILLLLWLRGWSWCTETGGRVGTDPPHPLFPQHLNSPWD
jgi:hypothetical protein